MILRLTIGALAGGVLGFAWYRFVGCAGGSCPLTSHPAVTTLYGATVGALVATSFH